MKLPHEASEFILRNMNQHNLATSRCMTLLQILWVERYLTRTQLIKRIEYRFGKKCFGTSAWQHTFYKDMGIVKQAFLSANYKLEYSRNKNQTGYYLQSQPTLLPEFKKLIQASIAEVDSRQINIYRQLSFAVRFQQGCDISDTTRNVVTYRIREENPKLSLQEAHQLALQRSYTA